MKKIIVCLLSLLTVIGMSPVYAKQRQRKDLNIHLEPMKLSFDDTPYVASNRSKRKSSALLGFHYFYDQLDQNRKSIYLAFDQMAKTGIKGNKVPFTLDLSHQNFSSEQSRKSYIDQCIYDAEFAVALDHPELITLYINLFDPSNDNDDPSDDPIQLSDYVLDGQTLSSAVYYTDDCEMYTKEEQELKTKAESVFETIDIDQPEAVVAKEIHDTLIQNVTYDQAAAEKSDQLPLDLAYTAYGSLVNGKAVCDGYALGYEYLCNLAHIESTVVFGGVGSISNPNSQLQRKTLAGHVWNEAKLSGEWYEVDTTWDDFNAKGVPDYTYYNLTTKQMSTINRGDGKHYRDLDGTAPYLPEATGTHYTAAYMNYAQKERTNATDPLNHTLDHYNKDDWGLQHSTKQRRRITS